MLEEVDHVMDDDDDFVVVLGGGGSEGGAGAGAGAAVPLHQLSSAKAQQQELADDATDTASPLAGDKALTDWQMQFPGAMALALEQLSNDDALLATTTMTASVSPAYSSTSASTSAGEGVVGTTSAIVPPDMVDEAAAGPSGSTSAREESSPAAAATRVDQDSDDDDQATAETAASETDAIVAPTAMIAGRGQDEIRRLSASLASAAVVRLTEMRGGPPAAVVDGPETAAAAAAAATVGDTTMTQPVLVPVGAGAGPGVGAGAGAVEVLARLQPPLPPALLPAHAAAALMVNKWQLYLLTLGGTTRVLTVDKEATVAQLKQAVHNVEGIRPDSQRLIFESKQMDDDDRKLREYGVQDGSTINLVLRLLGGGTTSTKRNE